MKKRNSNLKTEIIITQVDGGCCSPKPTVDILEKNEPPCCGNDDIEKAAVEKPETAGCC